MAFNAPMIKKTQPKLHPDSALIEQLGGAATLARGLGFSMPTGVQRVQNWKYRGIPELVRLKRADVFGPAPKGEWPR